MRSAGLILVAHTRAMRNPGRTAPGDDYPRHPDPGGERLCHALADAYAEGAAVAGYDVTRIEVAGLDFPILRTQGDFERVYLPESPVEAAGSNRGLWDQRLDQFGRHFPGKHLGRCLKVDSRVQFRDVLM